MTGAPTFADRLLRWFAHNGRHDLPWQTNPTPYRVWVSEIMLQQTQVTTVIPYYRRFLERFPDVDTLAGADLDEVLALWSGLGYYSRARNLHKAARVIAKEHAGRFPEEFETVMALPGIGRSTAGAILALSANRRHAILDGNCRRVLARYHSVEGWPGKTSVAKQLWAYADAHTPQNNVAEYTQAIMDLGATVCTRTKHRCAACPLSDECAAYAAGHPERYPTPRPRRTLPVRETRMLILASDNAVLMERRPPTGIWGGLWSLPETSEADVSSCCRDSFGVTPGRARTLTPFSHTFSHYRLDITPVLAHAAGDAASIMDTPDVRWVRRDDLGTLGIPAPVRHLLESTETWHEPSTA